MTRAEMEALIQRVEAAEEAVQAPWLKRAIDAAWKARWITDAVWRRADELLQAGAYLDAAVSLVPSGCEWQVHSANAFGGAMAGLFLNGRRNGERAHWARDCATPALALTAAALRALLEMERGDAG